MSIYRSIRFNCILLCASLVLVLSSCMATPDIHLNAGGVEMKLQSKDSDNWRYLPVARWKISFNDGHEKWRKAVGH